MPQRASPTSRLTQTSLELSPDNQVKLVTTKQAGRRNDNHRQTSKKQNTKRKRQSPLAQAGGGKRTKGKRSGMELVSPTIRDYFKTSGSESSKAPLRGERNVHTVYMWKFSPTENFRQFRYLLSLAKFLSRQFFLSCACVNDYIEDIIATCTH